MRDQQASHSKELHSEVAVPHPRIPTGQGQKAPPIRFAQDFYAFHDYTPDLRQVLQPVPTLCSEDSFLPRKRGPR